MALEKIGEVDWTVCSENYPYGRRVKRTVALCKCGAEIVLSDPMDNDCFECGRIYNMSGQEVRCHARDIDYLDAGEEW